MNRLAKITLATLTASIALQSAAQAATMPEVAHRGLTSVRVAESTPAAMTAAIKAKYAGVEFDVRLTDDNRAVVIHDTTFDRTAPQCKGYGKVEDRSLKTAEKCGVSSLETMMKHIQTQSVKYKWVGNVYVHVKVDLNSGTAKGIVNRVSVLANSTKRVVFVYEDEDNSKVTTKAGWKGRHGMMVHTTSDWSLVLDPKGPFSVAVTYDNGNDDGIITLARANAMKTLKRELWGMPGYPQTEAQLRALPITGLFVG